MSSLPIRTTAKVQSLRTTELDKSGKGQSAALARAVSLHLGEKREEALKSSSAPSRPGKAPPKSWWPLASYTPSWASFRRPPTAIARWCR